MQRLHPGPAEAGEYERRWDGQDQQGTRLPAGMYLIQLRIDDEVLHRNLILQP